MLHLDHISAEVGQIRADHGAGNDHPGIDHPQSGERPLADGRYAVQSYLDHQASKLVNRFDAGSYVALTDAMNTHDIGRGRGGVPMALRAIQSPLLVAGIDTDRLYPLRLQAEIAEYAPAGDGLHVVSSAYGHDGFLIEVDAIAELVTRTLARATMFA